MSDPRFDPGSRKDYIKDIIEMISKYELCLIEYYYYINVKFPGYVK